MISGVRFLCRHLRIRQQFHDQTRTAARDAGAIVKTETRQGKGHVVRRMFSDIDADVYLLVDGDETYDASEAPAMISSLVENRLGMVVGRRIHQDSGLTGPAMLSATPS